LLLLEKAASVTLQMPSVNVTTPPGVISGEGRPEMGNKGRLPQRIRSSAGEISRLKGLDRDIPVTEVWNLGYACPQAITLESKHKFITEFLSRDLHLTSLSDIFVYKIKRQKEL